MEHRYHVGDRVRLAFGFYDQEPVGPYEISALLPTRADGEPQYRIRGSDDRERVIGEGQIGQGGKLGSPARSRSGQNPITNEFNRLRRNEDQQ